MEKAFMGISIKNPFYSKKENILKAIGLTKDFEEFMIFVVDFPYRLSLQAFKNMSEQKAMEIALKEGEELRRFLVNITKQFENVKISSWENLADKNYFELLLEVKSLKTKDKEFSKLLEGEFVDSIILKVKNEKEKKLSEEFIVEEVAMFIFLALKGYSTRISKYSESKSVDYFLKTKNLNLNHIQIN